MYETVLNLPLACSRSSVSCFPNMQTYLSFPPRIASLQTDDVVIVSQTHSHTKNDFDTYIYIYIPVYIRSLT